jgi:hypothetical protein
MAYTTINKSSLHFSTKLYTGTGSAASITGVGFQPDWVWVKDRSAANSNQISDVLRGATKTWFTDAAAAENTDAQRLTSFDSDGFSVGTNSSWNTNSNNYVSWNWKAGGSGVTNTDGNMNTTVTVSANTTAGFSIVTWTGSGNTTYNTIGHGLGVAPKWVMVKNLTDAQAGTYSLTELGWTKALDISSMGASNSSTTYWNDTAPSSSVVTLGSSNDTNGTGDSMIAYCFAEKRGFSKFGKYIGNGNSNNNSVMVYTGFKPAFIFVQGDFAGDSSKIWDNKRPGYNLVNNWLEADDNQAEGTGSNQIDILSNGFKMRNTNTAGNKSGGAIYYMAFAAAPLVGSNNVPATAG